MERGCRAVALAALAALLWRAWRPAAPRDTGVDVATTAALPAALAAATRAPVAALELTLDSLPGARDREWAHAIASAGTSLRWRWGARTAGDSLAGEQGAATTRAAPFAALTIEPLADPSGRARLVAVARTGARLAIGDGAGSIDSSTVSPSGARVLDAAVDGVVKALTPGGIASTVLRDSIALRPVLVLANAGWEGKFVVAALEEAGWTVEARFAVAPGVAVRQGGESVLDTARFSAVVAVDGGAASQAGAIVRFVRDGGGLVVGGEGASIAALAPVLPARAGATIVPVLGAVSSTVPRRGLGGVALTAVRPDAVVLERSGGVARSAAVRVGIGRAILLGYDDTWRWRMEGGEGAPAAHREWWSSMVASVARAPLVERSNLPAVDEAPVAALVSALGAPNDAPTAAGPPVSSTVWDRILFVLLVGALLTEWCSRRLRGAR